MRGKAGDDADAVLREGWTPEASKTFLEGKKEELEALVRERMKDVKVEMSEEEIREEVGRLRKEWKEGKGQLEEVATDRMELVRRGGRGSGGRGGVCKETCRPSDLLIQVDCMYFNPNSVSSTLFFATPPAHLSSLPPLPPSLPFLPPSLLFPPCSYD